MKPCFGYMLADEPEASGRPLSEIIDECEEHCPYFTECTQKSNVEIEKRG